MGNKISPPAYRKLRGYAVDPSLGIKLSTASVNQLVYQVPWEELERRSDGSGGSYPAGEYVEIVDYDPASKLFYEPVDLDDPLLLAQDGHAPSVGNPQFHQQMVYAVVMTTIKTFERALGRKIQWAEDMVNDPTEGQPPTKSKDRRKVIFEFVPRLRIYPHALRQANAFYDPFKKALLFGYFSASQANRQLHVPGGMVFTCLSHDIIAHETTHAILDGIHRRYIDPSHPDTRAFHEAFSDMVALFQHFSYPEVLKHQIAETRGDLNRQNLLGQLAQEFGKAIGSHGSLRDAIGYVDADGKWHSREADPQDYLRVVDPHGRGSILVAAVFEAFLNIYRNRSRVLVRLATGGTGVLGDGELMPDLVDQLAVVASKTAAHVLRICIRALDYCPPVDITFGEYLRSLVTADLEMVVDDPYGYRVAFIEAFQRRGIFAEGIKSMSEEELVHPRLPAVNAAPVVGFLRSVKEELAYEPVREEYHKKTQEFMRGENGLHNKILDHFVRGKDSKSFSELTGLMFPANKKESEKLGLEWGYLSSKATSFAIGNLWLANRPMPDGGMVNQVILTLSQKRGVRFKVDGAEVTVDEDGYFVPDKVKRKDHGKNSIVFRGGCTLIVDLQTLRIQYSIKKDMDDQERMIRQFKYQKGMFPGDTGHTYFDLTTMNGLSGPVAMLHSLPTTPLHH